jgi:sugar lactone lactonase YvrE
MRHKLIALIALSATACAKEQPAPAPAAGDKLGETPGMKVPESVRYDAELDVFYVSNINGNPSVKDNNGFIARVRADSPSVVTMLVEAGKNGATLNAPKGMALHGDTIFVADIDVVRAFNRKTGAVIGNYAAKGATFLNDVLITPDGNVYITDTGIIFDAKGNATHPGKDQIYKLVGGAPRGMLISIFASDSLTRPNGIAWKASADGKSGEFILAPFGGPNVQSWKIGEKVPTTIAGGPGGFDGVEVLANGTILVSSWADSSVSQIPAGHPMLMPLVKNVSAPADIGVDTKRNVLAVPRFNDGKVEYYKLP